MLFSTLFSDGEDLEAKSEADVYVDNKSYVVLEIILEKPLIPKRPTSALAERCGMSVILVRRRLKAVVYAVHSGNAF